MSSKNIVPNPVPKVSLLQSKCIIMIPEKMDRDYNGVGL